MGERRFRAAAPPPQNLRWKTVGPYVWVAGDGALGQVWLFILAPALGAAIAGVTYARVTGAAQPAPEADFSNNI